MRGVIRNTTAGMVFTLVAGGCGLAVVFGADPRIAGLGLVLLALAHAEGMALMHRTFGAVYDGLANNLAAIGVVAAAVRNLEGGEEALTDETHRRGQV